MKTVVGFVACVGLGVMTFGCELVGSPHDDEVTVRTEQERYHFDGYIVVNLANKSQRAVYYRTCEYRLQHFDDEIWESIDWVLCVADVPFERVAVGASKRDSVRVPPRHDRPEGQYRIDLHLQDESGDVVAEQERTTNVFVLTAE